jgi:hypothetical protein
MQKTLDSIGQNTSPASVAAAAQGNAGVVRTHPFPAPVLLCGLATTALALIGVYLLERFAPDVNIMGWYADKILPVGAIIVGLAASSGYGISAWYSGLKFTKKLLWLVLFLQAAAYFGAEYIQFRGLNLVHRGTQKPVGFFEYYDATARSFAWKEYGNKPVEPLGAFGYFFRALELIGFAAGGLIVPAIMRGKPYCDRCLRYMHTKQLVYVPASIPLKKISKKDTAAAEAQTRELQSALDVGKLRVDALQAAASQSKVDLFETEIVNLKSERKKAVSLPIRFVLELVHCQSCRAGHLKTAMLAGQGQHIKRTEVNQIPVSEDFVRVMRGK